MSKRDYEYYHVDAFTTTPGGGNPAGVVPDADGLSPEQMQGIAREMGLSEVAYMLSPSSSEADVRIRWFTPSVEVRLCGHATVAAFHVLARAHMLPSGSEKGAIRLETPRAVLRISVTDGEHPWVRFTLPAARFSDFEGSMEDLPEILGLPGESLDPQRPVGQYGPALFIPVAAYESVRAASPDFPALDRWCREHDLWGIALLSADTVDPDSAVHQRVFVPRVGINEDPVTGSAAGPTVVYAQRVGLIEAGEGEVVLEQGDPIGRAGRVRVGVKEGPEGPVPTIAGQAVTVCAGRLRGLPEHGIGPVA